MEHSLSPPGVLTECSRTEGKGREGSKPKPPSVTESDVNPTPLPPKSPGDVTRSTRRGMVCGLLRKAGMSDAAPHYLTDEAWTTILEKRTDEEIVEVAKAKMASRPNQRIGLKYIAPALMEDPTPIAINGQKRRTIHDEREAVSIGLTGRNPSRDRQIADVEPLDITGESHRVA